MRDQGTTAEGAPGSGEMTLAELKAALAQTSERQARAADPAGSAWVAANAGTGKTHVLTMRVLRLLLAGTAPERILCLTYTKAAAAEMSTRIFDRLAQWVTAEPDALAASLLALTEREPSAEETARARTLFALAIETPGGLKVQTIHAFCERLLQRFPLEAGVPPGFSTLDDDLGRTLVREAIDATLKEAVAEPAGPLGAALQTAIAYAAEDRFDLVLGAAIRAREWLEAAVRMGADETGDETAEDPFAEAEKVLRGALGVRLTVSADGETNAPLGLDHIDDALASVLSPARAREAAGVLGEGGTTDQEIAAGLAAAARDGASPAERVAGFRKAFLTKAGEARSDNRFVTKAIRDREPVLYRELVRARDRFAALWTERQGLVCVTASMALMRLAADVLQRYEDAKARKAALDFEDLIAKAASLLATKASADWVLYKLDGGIDHILVDESQDTSPTQWRIVETLAREFFSGDTAGTERARTLFAVGDEKQSIYSFQGAAPEMFADMGGRFRDLARAGGQTLEHIPLEVSFRTVAPVLQAVDRVFGDHARVPGLGEARIQHIPKRAGHGGLVEVWPTEQFEAADEADVWSPFEAVAARPPAVRLSDCIAETIAGWLANGEELASQGRPVRAGDILILVRKRAPFAPIMVAALKARGIPVAGADRLDLNEQLAVQDLLALGDFVTLPEDDLALASVLKSPLIGFTDDDLLAIGHRRAGSLWKALIGKRSEDARYEAAYHRLKTWRDRADFQPPFEFLAEILDADGMRKRLIGRLGLEVADPLDELLTLAMAYDDKHPPSLTGFLTWLRSGSRQIKRDMEQGGDEVRVLTVHASKGLEAPIVFLPDTCAATSGRPGGEPLTALETAARPLGTPAPIAWQVKGAAGLEPLADARTARAAREREESHRLLYVAMTRARDRLYVAGFEGKKGRPEGCWYDLVQQGIDEVATKTAMEDGRHILRLEARQTEGIEPAKAATEGVSAVALPQWAHRPIDRLPAASLPLAPSQLAPYDTDEEGIPLARPERRKPEASAEPSGAEAGLEPGLVPDEPPVSPPSGVREDLRFLRGTLTHALLEHLPGIDPDRWRTAAQGYVERRGAELSAAARRGIVAEVLHILEDPRFGVLFSPRSQAEIAIAADIPRPAGKGPPLRLCGKIDRLAETEAGEILIVDYKTNRQAPEDVSGVAESYLLQLAAYRLGLRMIYPGRPIRAALLWTEGPRIHEIATDTLDKAEERLWKLAAGLP